MRYLLTGLVLFIQSCAVDQTPVAIGGSRSDGTVTMSYSHWSGLRPRINWNEATRAAAQTCRRWGYADAELFQGSIAGCNSWNAYGGCIRQTVSRQYQCFSY